MLKTGLFVSQEMEFWDLLYCCSGITLSNSLKVAHLLAMHLVFMSLWLYSWHWVFRYCFEIPKIILLAAVAMWFKRARTQKYTGTWRHFIVFWHFSSSIWSLLVPLDFDTIYSLFVGLIVSINLIEIHTMLHGNIFSVSTHSQKVRI